MKRFHVEHSDCDEAAGAIRPRLGDTREWSLDQYLAAVVMLMPGESAAIISEVAWSLYWRAP